MNARAALQRIVDGNRRFVRSAMTGERRDAARRREVEKGQSPFAAILCCSDSRVPPEIIFDQGIGDLFVVRVAGNIVDDITEASIEFAAAHLHVPLVLVLGHTECGAINAALSGHAGRKGHIPRLIETIRPSIEASGLQKSSANAVAGVHARKMAAALGDSSGILRNLVKEGTLRIAAGMYDLKTGEVEIF